MLKVLRFTEYLYLIVALLSVVKIISLWGHDSDEMILFVLFAVVSVGMFFFRRTYRKKFENRKNPS